VIRDPDLEDIYASAGRVTPAGVQHLVDSLQRYRTLTRDAIEAADAETVRGHETTSVYRLKDHLSAVAVILGELQLQLDLDHLDLGALTDGH
jgi:hypothetical protein